MGSGSRFQFGYNTGVWVFGLGIAVYQFPFARTIYISTLCFCITLGFGKAYDDDAIKE